MRAMLDGPRRPFDSEATFQKYREKYGCSDLSHLSQAEIEKQRDVVLDALPPEKITEARWLGLI